ncbi:hypothetical protein DOTSEDRAFT_54972 [Dothistroma septosporum NZE10]|uniref:CENP-V/GFA domain-containing protein n=1 Tax=Dothistroma septosporum (strain NZE10 / CBS 128990) TaxID=675120 RepID=N1PMH0_DOTSN|nr:hypothetical protein DOTSEDRAFT_54972 [Dothistroma septosporum NZE10]
MSGDIRTLKVGCHCGNTQHEIAVNSNELPLKGHMCHCTSCRHATGLLCLTTARLPRNYKPDPELLDNLTAFDFSDTVRDFFCPDCGTEVLGRWEDSGAIKWSVPVGALEQGDVNSFTIDAHIFVEDTRDGGLADFLPKFNGHHVKRHSKGWASEELPLYWKSPDRQEVKPPNPNERLHGYCKCRGVEFWLVPPSASSSVEAHGKGVFPEDR